MIGLEQYTLTSFEIIFGGIVAYVLGVISAFILVGLLVAGLMCGDFMGDRCESKGKVNSDNKLYEQKD